MDKYIHPNLRVEVPKELRLEIYKKAVEYYNNYNPQNDWSVSKSKGRGLCLVLPCILWDLVDYYGNPPHLTEPWKHHDTQFAFPEINPWVQCVNSIGTGYITISMRIEFLQEVINKLENE